jgi:hypothetical protein
MPWRDGVPVTKPLEAVVEVVRRLRVERENMPG